MEAHVGDCLIVRHAGPGRDEPRGDHHPTPHAGRRRRGAAGGARVTGAPVVTAEGMLRGIVSEVDLLRARPTVSQGPAEHIATAADVMTPQPVTVRPTDELAEVAAVLLDRGVRAVPVVDGERLVGILSRRDVLSLIAQEATTASRRERPVAQTA